MSKDLLDEVRTLLFAKRIVDVALLLDLAPFLPPELLTRAISLAQRIHNEGQRDSLLSALLRKRRVQAEVPTPAGREARQLISRLPPDERVEVFDELLFHIERAEGLLEGTAVEPPSPREEDEDEIRSGGRIFRMDDPDP